MPTFTQYQTKALQTALPTALTTNYLTPMIIGEIGELFGAQAKATRDNWTTNQLTTALAKELGDVAWGVAVALHLVGVSALEDVTPMDSKRQFPGGRDTALLALLAESRGILNNLHHGVELWNTLAEIAFSVTGKTFEEVLNMNLEKLADRQARGVLSGSGDNR